MMPWHDWQFWFGVLGATAFRILSSPIRPLRIVVVGAFGGIFSAVIFTDPLVNYLNANPETYKVAVAALLTLTGESILRLLMLIARDPSKGIELWKDWRGSNK